MHNEWLKNHVEKLSKRLKEMSSEEFHKLGVDSQKRVDDGTWVIGTPNKWIEPIDEWNAALDSAIVVLEKDYEFWMNDTTVNVSERANRSGQVSSDINRLRALKR